MVKCETYQETGKNDPINVDIDSSWARKDLQRSACLSSNLRTSLSGSNSRVGICAVLVSVKDVQTPCGNSRNSRVGQSCLGLGLSLCMCYALAVNWVPEKRSRLEQLRDVGDVDELKIDDDDDEGNAKVQSLDWIRGQTESDRKSVSKSIFRLE